MLINKNFISLTVCIGCPGPWVCDARVWGKCVVGHPTWNGCCKRITNPVCIAKNAGCYLLKKPLELAVSVAIKIVRASKHTLDVVKGVLSVAQGIVNVAKKTLDVAIAFLEGIKRAYRTGVSALSALTKFALTQIINIRKMYFKVGLSVANGGSFRCRIKGVLMGNSISVNLNVNVRNPLQVGKRLAERAVSGLSKFFG